ncbi:NAD(P)/FAD-dependent oxidoreductase [Methylophaga pinxianii]|uniref:NAD(P)/FAD-dependent oxidoreductase n=1 Tax=Methylophaga pinxianii TaxID=2881052 RepID=UPI001CF48EE7|nr:FAD-dependent oxidoreductase [Methylophaga pinxianii]MCB2426176.1 FAD-dependent oxidoreductase [Methylophaga pinxianii]UPH45046.1 FAD-dependent oxidoreductase [Methylophaga pinxianii]
MKIAVVGAGISGLSAAYYLAKKHDVTVFEASNYLGGHTDTHAVELSGKIFNVDTGFIVFNQQNYPNFSQLLKQLGVESQPTEMSFSVSNTKSGLEYNATDINRLFCQRRNLVNYRFYRMLWDLVRFYREAPLLLNEQDDGLTLGQYLSINNYSDIFINDHLIPMACALWSGPSLSVVDFPAQYFIRFMHNHHMLSLTDRPQWRVVKGGSKTYVDSLVRQTSAEFMTGSPIHRIERSARGVTLTVHGEKRHFDKVIIATHADQALRMLDQPSETEVAVLGGIGFQENEMHLHTDSQILPRNPLAWASWNVRVGPELQQQCTVSYHMNTLQSLDAQQELIVSLNSGHLIDPKKVLVHRRYAHPIYNLSTLHAQRRWQEIADTQHTFYCGAYWGWGFHEDGVSSALRVIAALENTEQEVANVA